MIYGSQNFTVTFPGTLGSVDGGWESGGWGSAKEGVRGTEWSEAGVGAIFHSDKINSALKGGEGGQRKLGQAYLGLQRSKGASSRSDRPCL